VTTLDQFSLSGRRALIIGGTSGIGREIALGYRDAGASTLIVGRRQDKVDAAVADLGGDPRCGYAADMCDIDQITALLERVESEHGPLDILVNCQGTTEIRPAVEVTEDVYDRILDTNLKSVFFCCTGFGRRMIARGSGAIVNIASLAAHQGWANAAPYSMSKFGVVALTQTLAAEWGGSGVRVNAISPGFFMTELNRERMPPERKAEATRRNAMHRFGELPELVGAAIYLASPAAAFVTGAVLKVDGGYLASGI
jgi:NAD(P)-dependent dehydrogenase (short-subunit alcohol dehydrogenase family)